MHWRADERGASTIEYAILAAGIFIVIVASVALIGPRLAAIFADVSAGFN